MKKIEFIFPIILFALLISCSKSAKKDSKVSSKNSKHVKMHTFVAPPPQENREPANAPISTESESQSLETTSNDSSEIMEISKYSYYEVTDSNQRLVRPELIEKYRRARNNNTYVNLYPTDWAGIMKDRGLKPVKEKKIKNKKQRSRTQYYNQPYPYHQPYYGTQYRPRGVTVFPFFSYGWNHRNGWTPNMGVAVGPRRSWGPYGTAAWGGRNRGMNYGMHMPYYNNYNMYHHPGMMYGNNYYNNVYNYITPVPSVVQSNGTDSQKTANTKSQTSVVDSSKQSSASKDDSSDWSDGVGGPEKYMNNTKKIEDYKVK